MAFSKQYAIDYFSVKSDLKTSFPRLMSYVQETTFHHAGDAGYPMEWYIKNNTGWIITNWQIEVFKYPKFCDNITISTWPAKIRSLFADRGFSVFNENNETLMVANSTWMYLDLNTKKPIRLNEEDMRSYGEILPLPLEKDFSIPLENFKLINCEEIKVTRRDTDTNNHVNNISYVYWAADYIPNKIYENLNIKKAKIAYKKECILGEQLKIETYINENNPNEFLSRVTKEDGSVSADIWTEWGVV